MKRIGRILAGILIIFVLAVAWYASAGQAFLARRLFTNDRRIAEGTHWVRSDKGLYGGPVTVAAVDPRSPETFYAGTTQDEVYFSLDAGSHWSSMGGVSTGAYVTGIVPAEGTTAGILGRAVYGAGFLFSRDNGYTWKNSSRGLGSRNITCLGWTEHAPGMIFAGTGDAGLYISNDAGRSWRLVSGRGLGKNISSVELSPDGKTVIAGTQGAGAWISHDDGATWSLLTSSLGGIDMVTGIDMNPADTQDLAMSITQLGVAVSTDGGRTWTHAAGLPSDCSCVATGIGGRRGIVAGSQSGTLWWSADGRVWKCVLQLPDDNHIYSLTHTSTGILAATTRGVLASADGVSWTVRNNGITNLSLSAVVASQTAPSLLYIGTDAGVFRSADGGASWSLCSPVVAVAGVYVSPDAKVILAGTTKGGILRSADGGVRWSLITKGIPGMEIGFLCGDAAQPGVIFMAGDGGFALSLDQGATWTTRNIGLTAASSSTSSALSIEVASMVVDSRHPGTILLALTGRGIYRTTNNGKRWNPLNGAVGTDWINSLAADGSRSAVYAGTTDSRFYRSPDRGVTWTRCGNGLSLFPSVCGTINTIMVTPDGTVYAGTELGGAAVSHDAGRTFLRLNADLPDIDVRTIVSLGSTVFAVTEHTLVRLAG